MTNYGTKFNEKDRSPTELRLLTYRTQEQMQAETVLAFIEKRERTGNGAPSSRIVKQEEQFAADYRRSEVPGGRYPWEPRPAGHIHAEPVAEYKWLERLLDPNPPWWRRLWRWVDPRKQFRDWDRDNR